MKEENLKSKTASGLLWGGVASGGQQVLNLVFGIVLGRLLSQSDYGMVGMLSVFILTASALQEGGFIAALNQKKEVTEEDYNSVFWFNFGVSVSLYTLFFFAAPWIAEWLYHEPSLVPLSRYVFLGFVVSSVNIVPRAYLFRNLKVKETTLITLSALLVSGIVGVTMAWMEMAYWGLATQSVVYALCVTIGSYSVTGWHPRLHFNLRPIREMFGFSSKLIVTYIFNTINNNLFSVLLGREYGKAAAGNFTQANKWNYMGHTLVTNMLNSVAQPVFAKLGSKEEQLQTLRKLLRITALFSFVIMFGLGSIADQFIAITIGEKWLSSAHILSLLCVWGAFIPLQTLYTNLLIARGHTNIYMWGTIGLALTEIGAALLMVPYGIEWMLRVFVCINILWLFVWHRFVQRETGLKIGELLRDILPYALLSVALCGAAQFATQQMEGLLVVMLSKIGLVGSGYILVLWYSRSEIFRECLRYMTKRKK